MSRYILWRFVVVIVLALFSPILVPLTHGMTYKKWVDQLWEYFVNAPEP